jgi:5-oxoprolinase (ATP-hydrolysing)
LPDITLITPVFDEKTHQIVFFTASRGHHADIGGILPGRLMTSSADSRTVMESPPTSIGSMPPTSVNIFEEGANIHSFKVVNNGMFDRKGLIEYMIDKPASYPGNSGCRNFRDVESDLKAVSRLVSSSTIALNVKSNSANRCEPQGYPAHPRS